MKVTAIASGSSGNCFYVENEKSAVLIDAGISAKHINLRMNELKLNPKKIEGIFLTHEHIDHIRGADVFARQLDIPIYATNGTAKNGFLCSNEELINIIKKNENVKIGSLEVEAFEKNHKAHEPVSFSVNEKNKVVSVITDVGVACKNVNERIGMSNFLFLESNYDPIMLENGPYPYFLKKWVKGDTGHLSNNQAGLAVLEHSHSKLKNVILSHISKNNNTPQVALKCFKKIMKERKDFDAHIGVSIADYPTEIFRI